MPDHLTRYLEGVAKTARLPAWRFRQIVDALRILFLEMVRAPWARGYPWDVWEARQESAGLVPDEMRNERRLEQTEQHAEPVLLLDPDSLSGVTATAHQHQPEAFVRLVAELRSRGYSYRTKTTYLKWLARYVMFHDGADPVTLGPDRIPAFLGHLAIKRLVAANTQKQALNAWFFLPAGAGAGKYRYRRLSAGHATAPDPCGSQPGRGAALAGRHAARLLAVACRTALRQWAAPDGGDTAADSRRGFRSPSVAHPPGQGKQGSRRAASGTAGRAIPSPPIRWPVAPTFARFRNC